MKTRKFTNLGIFAFLLIFVTSCMTSNRGMSGYNIQFRGATGSNEVTQSKTNSATVAAKTENNSVSPVTNAQNETFTAEASAADNQVNVLDQKSLLNALVNQNTSSAQNVISQNVKNIAKDHHLTFKEKVALKHLSAKVSKAVAAQSKSSKQPETWVYWVLMLLVPFGTTIAMYLYEGSWTSRVTANLLWTALCGLPGLIHAIIIIAGQK